MNQKEELKKLCHVLNIENEIRVTDEGENCNLEEVIDAAVFPWDEDMIEIYYDGSGMTVKNDVLGLALDLVNQDDNNAFSAEQLMEASGIVVELGLNKELDAFQKDVVETSYLIVELLKMAKEKSNSNEELNELFGIISGNAGEDSVVAMATMLAMRFILGYGNEFYNKLIEFLDNQENSLSHELRDYLKILARHVKTEMIK